MANRVRGEEAALKAVRLRITLLVHRTKIGQAAMARIATTHAMVIDEQRNARRSRSRRRRRGTLTTHRSMRETGIQGAKDWRARRNNQGASEGAHSVASRYRATNAAQANRAVVIARLPSWPSVFMASQQAPCMANMASVVAPMNSEKGLSKAQKVPAYSPRALRGSPRIRLPMATPRSSATKVLPTAKLRSKKRRQAGDLPRLRASMETARTISPNSTSIMAR